MSSKSEKDIVDKIVDLDEKLEKHKILQIIVRIISIIFMGIPIIFCVGIHMLYCWLVVDSSYSNREKIVFAWFPVQTNSGYVWMKNVKRILYCNGDMISYYRYRYIKI